MDSQFTSPPHVQEPTETPVPLIPTEEQSGKEESIGQPVAVAGTRVKLTQDAKAAILKTLELLILSITDLISLHGPLSPQVAEKLETLYSLVWK
jgi:hypothetical protein